MTRGAEQKWREVSPLGQLWEVWGLWPPPPAPRPLRHTSQMPPADLSHQFLNDNKQAAAEQVLWPNKLCEAQRYGGWGRGAPTSRGPKGACGGGAHCKCFLLANIAGKACNGALGFFCPAVHLGSLSWPSHTSRPQVPAVWRVLVAKLRSGVENRRRVCER